MQSANNKIVRRGNTTSFDITELWAKYFVYWPLFLVLIVVFLAGAFYYTKYKVVPMYESNARILIKDQTRGTDDSKSIEDLNIVASKKIIENEKEVIQSRSLISDVVKNLSLYAPVYQEGRIKTNSAYTNSPITIQVNNLNDVKPTSKIYFTYDSAFSQVLIAGNRFPLNQWVTTSKGVFKFTSNKHYAPIKDPHLFFAIEDPKAVTAGIQSRLTVESVSKTSSIINLSIRDEIADRGNDILDELIGAYNRSLLNDKNSLAKNTLSFLEERLFHISKDLDSIEHNVQQYRAKNQAIDISTQGQLFLQNVSTNDQKVGEINMQLAALNEVGNYLAAKNDNAGIAPSTMGVNDPVLESLIGQLSEAETKYERLRKTTGENNQLVVSLKDQMDRLRPSIRENIQNQRANLQATKKNLLSTNSSYSSLLNQMPKKERELIDISREQNGKKEIYAFLLKKREEIALSYASTVSDSKMVDKAEASFMPDAPNRKIIFIIAVMVATGLGIGLITLKDTLNSKILFRQEIENLTVNPIIGEVSYQKSDNPIVIGDGQRTFIAEQFRKLRNGLNFLGVNAKKKRLLVTSTIEGEGKSFIATNLALSLAMTGKKVALLELDLHNPSISKKLDIKVKTGISDYLAGEKELDAIIVNSEVNPNLMILPAGTLPLNPSELILNGKIKEMLVALDLKFDYIVIDSAPVSPVSDAYVISELCDATLYVIRHKYTPKIFVQRIDQDNTINQLKNVAIVFNGVHVRGFFKNNAYGYGYGYMTDVKKKSKDKKAKSKSSYIAS